MRVRSTPVMRCSFIGETKVRIILVLFSSLFGGSSAVLGDRIGKSAQVLLHS